MSSEFPPATERPVDHAAPTSAARFLKGSGEMAALVRAYDWSRTSLGPIDGWPESLKTATGLLLLSAVPLVMLWGDDGVMIYNDAYSQFAGKRHPKLLGSKVREGWPEVADFNDHVMRTVLAGQTLAYRDQELTLHRHGVPEQVWMNLDYSPVLGEDGEPAGVIAIVIETTERVLADRRLVGERQQLGQLFEQAPTFMTLLRGPEHRFELANPRYYRLVGARDIIGKTVAEALPEAVSQGFVKLLDEVYRSGIPFTANGHRFVVQPPGGAADERVVDFVYQPILDEAGDVSGIFVEGVDVTDRMRADLARRESEEQFRVFAQAVPNHVWASRPNGFLYWLNDRVYVYFGQAPGSLDGKTGWTRFVHPDDLPAAGAAWAHSLSTGDVYQIEFRLRRADGVFRWFLIRAEPVRASDGSIVRWVGTNTDIDERRRHAGELTRLNATLEEQVTTRTAELMKAEEALRQSQKMEAVGQLTGGIAHDFNNLLTGITGSLELVNARIAQGRTGELDRYIGAAQGAARRAAALTHRLLAFSRQQTLEPKPTNLNRLVSGMEELVRRTIGPGITLETVALAGLWNTFIDQGQLENALLNLCINARDAMPHGGKLTIETGNRWLDERGARERDLEPGQYVSLCVSDTGTGMPPEIITRAFDPFFTTKPMGQGTGLGLSMIYGFVRQSAGQVRIYSEVGHGAMVCIYLPRHLGESSPADLPGDVVPTPRSAHHETVLIVDDEPTIRMLVTEILEELGYTAIEAADGASGLRILNSTAKIDLLVTDVGLPGGMNGRQMVDAARIRRPDLKVLFITGYAENAVLSHGHLDAGMHVLTKPFAIEALASRIRDIIGS